MEVSHGTIQVVLLLYSFLVDQDMADSWFNAGLTHFVQAVLLLFILFNCISVILIGQLLYFHMGLQRENLTTYQYIVNDHKKKREQMRLDEDLFNHRLSKIAEAYRDGKNLLAARLRIGRFCREVGCTVCDPLSLPKPREPDPEAGFAAVLGDVSASVNREAAVRPNVRGDEAVKEAAPQTASEGTDPEFIADEQKQNATVASKSMKKLIVVSHDLM